jgi:tetratricopeptide (TPR) repeat protein
VLDWTTVRSTALAALVLVSPALADAHSPSEEKLGTVNFPVTCTPAAQAEFVRGAAALHSFWFDTSRKAFTAAAASDSACGIAHWGVAMTALGNPLAGPPPAGALRDGWAAVEKARAAGSKSQRERDYVEAIAVFYRDADKVEHRVRAQAYEKAMEALAARYPDDREASIFYALSLNVTPDPSDKTYANQLKAATILEKVFAEQPNHPGVAHYLIHSYDFPPIAPRGLNAARRYAAIAPSAPHALHMPSHIFTRLGYWQESVDTNRASAEAATDHGNWLHAVDYMIYGNLQLAKDDDAQRAVKAVQALGMPNSEYIGSAYALAAVPARYALERQQWGEAATLGLQPAEFPWSRWPMAEAVNAYARGLGAARGGDAAGGRREADRLAVLRDTMAKTQRGYWADQAEIQRQAVLAWTMRAEGKHAEALTLMQAAVTLEDKSEKHPVTPGPIVPARELLGEMLLEMNQPAQALSVFEASMRVEPNRFHGLAGAARAAELAGDRERARRYYSDLLALAKDADTERPEIKRARAFVGTR